VVSFGYPFYTLIISHIVEKVNKKLKKYKNPGNTWVLGGRK
jgi:hypothetical protein